MTAKTIIIIIVILLLVSACQPAVPQAGEASQAAPSKIPPTAGLPNPASVHCEEQGYTSEIRTAADGSQSGVCIFPDGSECDEWAFFRGECTPASQVQPTSLPVVEVATPTSSMTEIPTPMPIDPTGYQGWWTYTHAAYNFSIMLPEDWVVEEVTTNDPLMNGHMLNIHPNDEAAKENIRMTFRRAGEEVLLWPTGVGQGEFLSNGTIDVAGQAVQRVLLICPTGEVSSIWYQ